MGAGKTAKGIPNLGSMKCEMLVESGELGRVDFDAAEIRKPLLAVSSVNKKGNPVWFDGNASYTIPGNADCLSKVRELLAAVPNKIPLHLENGTFKMRTWRKKGANPFQRQGK